MDTKYPPLKRPAKRKLSYFSNKEGSSKKLPGAVTCGDVDRIFDDLDSGSHDEDDAISDPFPPSPPLDSPDSDKDQVQRKAPVAKTLPGSQMVKENALATKLPSSAIDVDVHAAFKEHWPSQTSSPITDVVVEKGAKEQQKTREGVKPPVVNGCEDKGKEEVKKRPAATQKPQDNVKVTKKNEVDGKYPVVLLSALPTQKKEVEKTLKESQAVKEKTTSNQTKPPVTSDLPKKGIPPQRQEKTQQPVATMRQEPEFVAPKKPTESVDKNTTMELSSRARNDLTFLQKLLEVHQPKPKPAPAKNVQPPVQRPPVLPPSRPEPEPEDDFLILEDDSPSWFSLTSKVHKKRRLSQNSYTEASSVDDKSPPQMQDKPQKSKQPNGSAGGQDVAEKVKKTKKNEKKNVAKEAGNYLDVLCSPQGSPDDKVTEEETGQAGGPPGDTGSGETDEGAVAPTKTKKARQPSDSAKGPQSRVKGGNQNTKKTRTKPLKPVRKAMQGPDVKETAAEKSQESTSSEEPTDTPDLGSSTEKETNTEAGKTSSEEEVGKRKRRPAGQWWVCSPQSAEQTEEAHSSPTLKKQNKRATTKSTKKDAAVRGKVQTESALPSSQSAAREKKEEKKSKRKKINVEPEDRWPSSEEEPSPEESPAEPDPSHTSEKETTSEAESVQVGKSPQPPPVLESSSDDEVVRKRKRRPTGQWWLCTRQGAEETEQAPSPSTLKKQKQSKKAPSMTTPTATKTKKDKAVGRRRDQVQTAPPPSQNTVGPKEKKTKCDAKRNVEPAGRRRTRSSDEDLFGSIEAEQQLDLVPVESSPVAEAEPDHGLQTPFVSLIEPTEPLQAAESAKTKRSRLLSHNVDRTSSQPQPPQSKAKKQRKPTAQAAFKTPARPKAVLPLVGTLPLGPPTVKRSLATFTNIFTSAVKAPNEVGGKEAAQKKRAEAGARASEASEDDAGAESAEPSSLQQQQQHATSPDMSKLLRSGPSSIIDLQRDYADDFIRMSSPSDLCGPPLKPLILIAEDKDNLQNWLDDVWSSADENSPRISVDHFDWFCYRDRALGFQVDLNSGSISNGKILMGQYSMKPLWLDHCTTTVYNLLSSSVSVTIDGQKSCYYAGQSFIAPCGHAYSIQNITSQPAVLYFTRLFVESSD